VESPGRPEAEGEEVQDPAGIPKQSVTLQADVSRDIWNALVRYRGDQEIQLGREYSMSEALNALLAEALGLVPPAE